MPESGSPEAAANDALAGKVNYRSGDGEATDLTLAYNLQYDLTDDFSFYSFGTYADRDAEGSNFFRYAVSDNNVESIYPNGFVPVGFAKVTDTAITVGIDGEMQDWVLDTSLSYGSNEFDDNVDNSVNSSVCANIPTSFNRAE